MIPDDRLLSESIKFHVKMKPGADQAVEVWEVVERTGWVGNPYPGPAKKQLCRALINSASASASAFSVCLPAYYKYTAIRLLAPDYGGRLVSIIHTLHCW